MSLRSIQLTAVAIYGWYLLNIIIHAKYFSMLWGSDSGLGFDVRHSGLIENMVYHLSYAPQHAEIIAALHIACSACAMFSFQYVGFFRLAAWLTGWMLYYAAYYVFDSGYLLIQTFSFLLIFQRCDKSAQARDVNRLLTFALQAVLIIGYVASSAFKLSGEQWWNGTAFYYAMHLEYLTGTVLPDCWWANEIWISKCLSWGSLLYQLLFPIMIFWRRFTLLWLLMGVLFHLLTMVLFGLWGFGLAMLAAYFILLPEKWSQRLTLKAVRE